MKKYIYISLALLFSFNTPVFANINNNIVLNNKIQNNVIFFYNGLKYSIIDENNVALEYFPTTNTKNITLPNSVLYNQKTYYLTEIKEDAFAKNNTIETINLNMSLKNININTFNNLTNLKNINVTNNSTTFTSINGVLFSKDKKTLIYYPNGKTETEYTIPPNVNIIGNSAFKNNNYLKKITFNSFVTEIEDYAFYGTKKLEEIKNITNVKKVGNYAFANSSIKNIIFSNTIQSLGTNIFENSKIENFSFPSSITSVPKYTFNNCKNLKNVNLNNNIKSIDEYAFSNSSITSITSFLGLTNIKEGAFYNSDLKEINNALNIKSIEKDAFKNTQLNKIYISGTTEIIGENAFENIKTLEIIQVEENNPYFESYNNCLYTKGKKELILIPSNTNEIIFEIPNETGKLNLDNLNFNKNLQAFQVNENNQYFSVIDGVLYSKDKKTLIKYPIGKEAQNFTIPNFVEKIEENAFKNTINLRNSLNIPSSIKEIGKDAFSNSNIESFIVNNNNQDFSSYDGILYNNDKSILLKCPPNVTGKTKTIAKETTTIAKDAFKNINIENIIFNEKLEIIEQNAFENFNTETITFNYGLKEIKQNAFYNSKIQKIIFPSTLEKIEQNAFKDCKNLYSITFKENNFKYIANNAFKNCDNISIINIPKGTYNSFNTLLKGLNINIKI